MNPSTPRVLAVDDDPLILDIITEMLAGTGCVLETVADGEAAWERLVSAAEPIDVVLLDWQMPGLDGMHLLQRIKSTPTMLELPVIMQTSMADKARVAEGLANGAFYYLVKPFSQAELRAITHAAITDLAHARELRRRTNRDRRALGALQQARYRFRTTTEAQDLGVLIANACPQPERVVMGLSELLLNAVEHGNLELSYDDKSRLIGTGRLHEEIEHRLQDPCYAHRWVTVDYHRGRHEILIEIADQGRGFDWTKYLDFSPERVFDSHGRGIAMARASSFDTLEYHGCGSELSVTVALSQDGDAAPAARHPAAA